MDIKVRSYDEIPRLESLQPSGLTAFKIVKLKEDVNTTLSELPLNVFQHVAAVRERPGKDGPELVLYRESET